MSSESFGWSWHSGVLWRGDSVYWGLAGKSKFFGLLEGQAGVEASLTQGCRGECWSTALAPLALVGTKFNLSSMLLQWFNLDNVCRLTGLFKFQEWWMIWATQLGNSVIRSFCFMFWRMGFKWTWYWLMENEAHAKAACSIFFYKGN